MPFKDPKKRKSYQKEYDDKTKSKDYKKNLKKLYNLTPDDVSNMYLAQNGCCAICLNPFINKKHTHIDHDHATGKVRQLLCNKCNVGLGLLREDILILANAIEYLRKWSS